MPEEILETPQPVQTVEQKTTNRLKIILVAVLGLGLLVGAAYAGYWYGTQQVQQIEEPTPVASQPTPKPTPTPTPEPTTPPVTDPTSDWKTYTTATYNYSVMYPQNFFYSEATGRDPMLQVVSFADEQYEKSMSGERPAIVVEVYEDDGLSPEAWFEARATTESFESRYSSEIYFYKVTDRRQTTSGGTEKIQFVDNKITGAPIPTTLFFKEPNVVSIRGYYFGHDEDLQPVFDLMLPTFKFLD